MRKFIPLRGLYLAPVGECIGYTSINKLNHYLQLCQIMQPQFDFRFQSDQNNYMEGPGSATIKQRSQSQAPRGKEKPSEQKEIC